MGGRRRRRRVGFQPKIVHFQPQGGELLGPNGIEVILKIEEMESIRLKDYFQMSQEEAAKMMGVSQPTFHRILSEAHSKIAAALVEGRAIRIEGGDYVITMSTLMSTPKGE
jgi:hypothetical protein